MRRSTASLLGICTILGLLLCGTTYIIFSAEEAATTTPEILSEGYIVDNQAIQALRSNNFPYSEDIIITKASLEHPTFLWIAIIFDSSVILTGQLWNEQTQETIIPAITSNETVIFEIWIEEPCHLVFGYLLRDQPIESRKVKFIFQWQISEWVDLYDHIPNMATGDADIYYGAVLSGDDN